MQLSALFGEGGRGVIAREPSKVATLLLAIQDIEVVRGNVLAGKGVREALQRSRESCFL